MLGLCAGDEFYMKEWPQLTGRSFMEVLVSFPDAIPLGIRNSDGLSINPDDNYLLQKGALPTLTSKAA